MELNCIRKGVDIRVVYENIKNEIEQFKSEIIKNKNQINQID